MKTNIKLFLLYIFLFSVAIKLILAYWIGNKFTPTLWEYETIASNIVNGKGFLYTWDISALKQFNIQFRSIQEPFFPVWCAFIYYFTNHSVFVALILQILYASLIPIIVYFITNDIYGNKVAFLSSFFVLFTPGINYYSSTKLHQMPLYSLFFCVALLLTLKLFTNFSIKNQILLGATLGISLLTRSTTIFVIIAIFLWLGYNLKIEAKNKIFGFFRIFSIILLTITPWVVRNYYIHKRLVLFQSSDGYFFYIATNPQATGTLYLPNGQFQLEAIPKELLEKYDTLTEMQFRDLMMSEAWKFIKENPARIVRLSFLKVFYFWWFSPISGKAPGYEYPANYIKLYIIYYITLLFVFLYQLSFIIKKYFSKDKSHYLLKETLVLLFLLAVMLPHIILYPEGRHRFAIEPLLLIFAARRLFLWGEMLVSKLNFKYYE